MRALPPGGRDVRLTALFVAAFATAAPAQQPVTRAQAVAAALARGPRVARAAPDVASARADVSAARTFQNPTAVLSYTGDVPRYHAEAEIPLDFPWLRSARIGAARAALASTEARFAYERASARFDAEAAYVRALAAGERARVSRRNARDADSLLVLARLRRETGDASELDLEMAAVSAGQLDAAADADSLAAVAGLLDLQAVMGLASDRVAIALADSLVEPPASAAPADSGPTLLVSAADAAREAGERALSLARRGVLAPPALTIGSEGGGPPGDSPGPLLIVGISLPIPLFNWNGAAVQAAAAERDRARVEAELARRESDAAVAAARRELAGALRRVARDRVLLASAERVAQMSLLAYAEGAAALPAVLEAQRTAREALSDTVADLAAANVAEAALRLLTAREGP
jgi:cobalt-zinc-cadmium efflux system outer membrane protein